MKSQKLQIVSKKVFSNVGIPSLLMMPCFFSDVMDSNPHGKQDGCGKWKSLVFHLMWKIVSYQNSVNLVVQAC